MAHFYLKPLLSMSLGSEDIHLPTISHHSTSVDLTVPATIFKDLHCKGRIYVYVCVCVRVCVRARMYVYIYILTVYGIYKVVQI
jgi:hypothetical protein